MTDTHTHPLSPEMLVYWIPADTDVPMEAKLIPNTLDALQSFVGGYIERVHTSYMPELPCGCNMVMIVNEEGALRPNRHNLRAQIFYPFSAGIYGDTIMVGEGLVAPDKLSPHYDPEDPIEPNFFSLPTSFNNWEGPGSPVPTSIQPWEG